MMHSVRHLDHVDVHVDPCGHRGIDPHAPGADLDAARFISRLIDAQPASSSESPR